MVDIIPGGMNYYPSNPFNLQKDDLDYMMKRFPNTGYQQVGVKIISEILNYIDSEEDSNLVAYKEAIKTIISNNPLEQGVLIVRTVRAVTQGTGSLLSPNDRELGNEFKSKVVLTMYQIDDDLGWKQKNIWVPNIKLPEFINYYNVKQKAYYETVLKTDPTKLCGYWKVHELEDNRISQWCKIVSFIVANKDTSLSDFFNLLKSFFKTIEQSMIIKKGI